MKKQSRGIFISFEGIEGAGKSTQARMCADALKSLGHDVVLTREPGGTVLGKRIRSVLLDINHKGIDPVAELLLYNADRCQHIRELIQPALKSGSIVITDRFSDSTRAYQGVARGLGADVIKSLDKIATGGLKPDLTILIDIDPESGLKRNSAAGKSDRLELEDIKFHRRVRRAFLEIQKSEPKRVKLVSGTDGPDAVHETVMGIIGGTIRKSKPRSFRKGASR